MHEVLANRLGGLSLPRKSVVRLTDRPDMTLDVYRGRKTTKQTKQNQAIEVLHITLKWGEWTVIDHITQNALSYLRKQYIMYDRISMAWALMAWTLMARTLMACLPCLTRTGSLVPMIPYMRLLWSNFCIYVHHENFDHRSLHTGLEPLEFGL